MLISLPVIGQKNYTEMELKAGYIVNFSKYVEWPNQSDIFVLGILGEDPFGAILEEMTRHVETPQKKWIIEHYTSVEQALHCNILFVGEDKSSDFMTRLSKFNGKAILTVANQIPDFCKLGGIVNLNSTASPFPFNINPTAAQNVCLKINIELFRLANIIGEKPSNNYPCSNKK